MTYKCVFSDIDGTLLNSKHQISEKTKKKVQQLAIQNIPFILVSARMPKGMHYFLDELQIKAPMVSYSGGLILDENQKVIYSKGFSVEWRKDFINILNIIIKFLLVFMLRIIGWSMK